MDTLLNALPEKVHVALHIEEMPSHNDPWPSGQTYIKVVPKEWIKHGERGRYNEFTWKKKYERKIKEVIGEDLYLHAHVRSIVEWNILENIGRMLHSAECINFDVLSYIDKINPFDVKYQHNIDC